MKFKHMITRFANRLNLTILLLIILSELVAQDHKQAQRSDDFVHYMGINYNFGRDGGVFDSLALAKLDELNIRFVRSWLNFIPAAKVNTIKDLGIRVNGLWKDGNIDNPLGARTRIKALGPDLFDFIEGHNEPDIESRTDSYGGCANDTDNNIFCASQNYQDDMYDDLKSDSATSSLPIIAVSLAKNSKIQFLAPLKHDRRNFHYYPGRGPNSFPTSGNAPVTDDLPYQDLIRTIDDYGTTANIHITETGHSPNQYSDLAQAKYIGRIFTEFTNTISDLEKVYYFKLLSYDFNPYGLITPEAQNRPAFNALKGMINLLSDANYNTSTQQWIRPTFVPDSLSISYAGRKSTTHDLLLQKADGDYYLLIWQEVNSYTRGTDPITNPGLGDLSVADDNLTLSIGGATITSATQYRYDSNFNYQPSSPTMNGINSLTLDVPDHVMIIQLSVDKNNAGIAPTVSILTPTDQDILNEGSDIEVEAEASDVDGSITQVEFLVDGSSIGVDVDGSDGFTATLSEALFGNYSITAIAKDNENFVSSVTKDIKVNPTIVQTPIDPILDGNIDPVWADAIAHPFINILSGEVGSDADLSGHWKAMWNTDTLYTLVEVNDDQLINDSGDRWFRDDAIEFYLDSDNSKGTSYDGINDFQYGFRWNDSTIQIGSTSPANSAIGVNYVLQTTPTGYRLEAAFPWATLGITPSEEGLVGIEVQINDDDNGGGRDKQVSSFVKTLDAFNNPSVFATATLISKALPSKPTNLTGLQVNFDQIDLAWEDNTALEDGYIIERKDRHDCYQQIATVGENVTSYSDKPLFGTKTFNYRVKAINQEGGSDFSNELEVDFSSRFSSLNLTSFCSQDPSYERKWRIRNPNNFSIPVVWKIYRSKNLPDTVIAPPGDSYFFSEAKAGHNVAIIAWKDRFGFKRVKVKASSGAQCDLDTPEVPTELQANALSATEVSLSWADNSDNENSFKIERKTEGSPFVQIAALEPDSENYLDTELTQFEAYTYRVRAFQNESGHSPYSNLVTTTATIPPTVSILQPSVGDIIANDVDITILAEANDQDGFVISTMFYANDSLIGTDTDSTGGWSMNWLPATEGAYSLKAVATDNHGALTSSDVIPIQIINPDFESDLLAYYPLDETEGDIAEDVIAGNNGYLQNYETNKWVSGRVNGALQFDGIDDWVSLLNGNFLQRKFTERTIAMWVNPDDIQRRQIIFEEGGKNVGIAMRFKNGELKGKVRRTSTQEATVEALNIQTNNWNFVTLVYGIDSLKFFVDGIKVFSVATEFSSQQIGDHANPPALGARDGQDAFGKSGLGDFFGGLIDEVRVYDRALNTFDIASLYAHDLSRTNSSARIGSAQTLKDDSLIKQTEIVIYPNPATNQLWINYSTPSDLPITLSIADISGRVIWSIDNTSRSSDDLIAVDVRGLKQGVYLLKMTSGSEIITKRIMINKD